MDEFARGSSTKGKLALQRIGSMCLDHGTTVRELIPALRTRVSQCFLNHLFNLDTWNLVVIV